MSDLPAPPKGDGDTTARIVGMIIGGILILAFMIGFVIIAVNQHDDTPANDQQHSAEIMPDEPATSAPSSRADAVRQAFSAQGITFSGTDAELDSLGDGFVCGYLDQYGVSYGSLMALTQEVYANSPLDAEDSAYAVGVFVGAYCPEYTDEVQAIAGAAG
jgi:hypothetical protein